MSQSGEAGCEVSLELQCLFALREAQLLFQDEVVSQSRRQSEASSVSLTAEEYDLLRSTDCQHIAEFYYLAQKYRLWDRSNIRAFLMRHNDLLRACIDDKAKRDALGLSKARLEEGIFSDQQIQKVIYYISDDKLCLDQSDLGRLLSKLQSPETTRKTVVALAKSGFLHRINTGRVLVVSTGLIESIFERHLGSIVTAMRNALMGNGNITRKRKAVV